MDHCPQILGRSSVFHALLGLLCWFLASLWFPVRFCLPVCWTLLSRAAGEGLCAELEAGSGRSRPLHSVPGLRTSAAPALPGRGRLLHGLGCGHMTLGQGVRGAAGFPLYPRTPGFSQSRDSPARRAALPVAPSARASSSAACCRRRTGRSSQPGHARRRASCFLSAFWRSPSSSAPPPSFRLQRSVASCRGRGKDGAPFDQHFPFLSGRAGADSPRIQGGACIWEKALGGASIP